MKIDILLALPTEKKIEIYNQSNHRIAFCDYCGEVFVGKTEDDVQAEGFAHIHQKHESKLLGDLKAVMGKVNVIDKAEKPVTDYGKIDYGKINSKNKKHKRH